jgi:hypothetical protein
VVSLVPASSAEAVITHTTWVRGEDSGTSCNSDVGDVRSEAAPLLETVQGVTAGAHNELRDR